MKKPSLKKCWERIKNKNNPCKGKLIEIIFEENAFLDEMCTFIQKNRGMLHLKKVVQQMPEKDSGEFLFWLKQNNAEKFMHLFSLMRENSIDEVEIANQLKVNASAFYTLKSRLYGKIQKYFVHNVPDSEIDLLRNVANIPNLIFNFPRNTAITHLLKVEKELIEQDMPYVLTVVYSALKRLHRYSPKYYDYTQLYNKHLAYTIAVEKAKELLFDFNKTLGEYLMSFDKNLFEQLCIIQQEMRNYSQLYKSHHLKVYQNILDIEFALFLSPMQKGREQYEPVDEILSKTEKIITSYKNDGSYEFLINVLNFLWFQYYKQLKLFKKEEHYFKLVNEKLCYLLLCNFCCFPSAFLISKIEYSLINNEEEKLYEESKHLVTSFTPDPDDIPNYINYVKFQATAAFYSQKYNESFQLLNKLLNTTQLRNFPHAEIEIKLYLALCYLLVNKPEPANNLIKNIQRKLRDMGSDNSLGGRNAHSYENARTFAKMLSPQGGSQEKVREAKMFQLRDEFQQLNQKQEKMLEYIRLDDAFIKVLLKATK